MMGRYKHRNNFLDDESVNMQWHYCNFGLQLNRFWPFSCGGGSAQDIVQGLNVLTKYVCSSRAVTMDRLHYY